MTNQNQSDQIIQNMRFYGELRFKQFTLFLAWLTIVATAITKQGSAIIVSDIELKLLLAFASLLVCGILWVMEISSTMYWVAHREVNKVNWPRPTFKLRHINATNAVLLLYVSNYIFWYWCTIKWNGHCVLLTLFALFGISLVLYSFSNYLKIWKYKEE